MGLKWKIRAVAFLSKLEAVAQKLASTSASCPRKGKASRFPGSFINKKLKINMKGAPPGSDKTSLGHKRNGPWFWRQMVDKHPHMFDKKNKKRITDGRSPIINDKWIEHNPTHAPLKGDKLVHHHMDQGPEATPLPKSVHEIFHSELHPHR
jgi:hypothetical protein